MDLSEKFMNISIVGGVSKNKTFRNLHIPHSDVFFVRAAIEQATGMRYSLEHVEKSMLLEGWKDG